MKTNRSVVRIVVFPAATLLGLFILTVQSVGQQAPPAGEKLYRNYCAVCHGEKGDGKGIAAPSFGGKIADFTNPDYWKKTDDKKIVNVILKGQGRMPAQLVSPEEARAIVDYMKSSFRTTYGS
ncbi:MAG TPA: cytochrome c [Syntrophales bacterium]|nr:cytochrome c [Syntrophobacterales bacterium]HNQ02721.1 cytochrome c [Syntrophales bacterium]HQL89913.1 cytochrome c [Syntrophales bacterium]